MKVINYPIQNIHLEPHKMTLLIIRYITFVGGVIVATACLFFALDLFFLHKVLGQMFGQSIANVPTFICLSLASLVILFFKKCAKHYLVLAGAFIFAVGGVTVFEKIWGNLDIVSALSAGSLKAGLIFLFIGQAMIIISLPPFRRFYYAQSILLLGVFTSLYDLLQNFYKFILLGGNTFLGENSILTAFLFFILCLSFFLIGADRGFLSFFTMDTRSSQFARRAFLYIVFLAPLIGIGIFFIDKTNLLTMTGELAFTIVLFMLLFIAIIIINVKLLYSSEVELYLMREELRVNNIQLELDASDLTEKVGSLESSNKEVSDKLNYQQTLSEIVDHLS